MPTLIAFGFLFARLDDGNSDPVSVANGIQPTCAVLYEKLTQTVRATTQKRKDDVRAMYKDGEIRASQCRPNLSLTKIGRRSPPIRRDDAHPKTPHGKKLYALSEQMPDPCSASPNPCSSASSCSATSKMSTTNDNSDGPDAAGERLLSVTTELSRPSRLKQCQNRQWF
jgi:hypothetical protein